ncbi:cation:dicarboxylase symporter family transporter [Pseudoalteromonas sp. G4]|uniref:cation:dicarboxylate symporter family transporter n=2 Tax=Pseudoalteromonas sp. G4 TaxID=2992761 RepID=UPI00237E2600|nr:cation:dicarboxylase symporter family transporter [Pseudoalteromonas sp. G4]MDE3274001.1 cation:dicarboxylase symporter family transporter [Pseudoalteromonas sp. G4]
MKKILDYFATKNLLIICVLMKKILDYFATKNLMLWALIWGVLAGVIFGERLAFLQPVGNGFIKLMQITIFPYIVVSLIVGLGKFEPDQVRSILLKAATVMLSLWGIGLFVIWCFAFTLPKHDAGTFFSTALISAKQEIDFVARYIPSNPFASMAEGNVPALVIFCIALGMALMGNVRKSSLLNILDVVGEGLSVISKKIVKIFPIGIFAITASSAGTMSIDQLSTLQVYLVLVILLGVFLMFVLLPMLVSALTPVKYHELIDVARNALITAFTTGNVFITLPVITEGIKSYMHKNNIADAQSDHIAEVLVPIAFTFPSLGKLTTLIFVLFAAWLTGHEATLADVPNITISALFSYFANVHIAIPYMLETVRVPADTYQLYLAMSVISAKFVSPTTVVYIVAVTFLSIFYVRKQLSYKRAKSILYFSLIGGLLPACMLAAFTLNTQLLKNADAADDIIANMVVSDKVPEHVLNHVPKSYEDGKLSLTNISVIKKRNLLRVGYIADNVPFSYFNHNDELVGFDISLAHKLAEDLGVKVEFIPFKKPQLIEYLNKGYFDIAMSGLEINLDDIEKVLFTDPVLELQLALVTLDHRSKEFQTLADLKEHESLNFATIEYQALLGKEFKRNKRYTLTNITSYRDFFSNPDKYDALIISAEAGFAWTMFYPDFGVIVPEGVKTKYPTGFAVAKRHNDLANYLNAWLDIRRANGKVQEVYDYWILGKGSKPYIRRWSVIDDIILDKSVTKD